jgi:hypothetical protein
MNGPCFQCDLDIGHVCYAGDPNASWGLTDRAVEALDAANRYLSSPPGHAPRATKMMAPKKAPAKPKKRKRKAAP